MTGSTDYVTVVSGLPRSGTSMMMRMLDEAGVPAVSDRLRTADDDNPGGYYEFEPVKELPTNKSWVAGARGHAVKVIYKLVYELPQDVDYRIVFMARHIEEVLASQSRMLARSGITVPDGDNDLFRALFTKDLAAFKGWVKTQPNIRIAYIDYRRVLDDTRAVGKDIAEFLERDLDLDAFAAVVDPELYRNRSA
ncbi:MAG: sulfotransferase domain-containing protein [Paracoccaceae bacterium]